MTQLKRDDPLWICRVSKTVYYQDERRQIRFRREIAIYDNTFDQAVSTRDILIRDEIRKGARNPDEILFYFKLRLGDRYFAAALVVDHASVKIANVCCVQDVL